MKGFLCLEYSNNLYGFLGSATLNQYDTTDLHYHKTFLELGDDPHKSAETDGSHCKTE